MRGGARRRRRGVRLRAAALALVAAVGGPARHLSAQSEEPAALRALLRDQPPDWIGRLLEKKVMVLAPDAASDASGGMVEAYVLFDRPAARVYELLSATGRQREFRSELASQTTVSRETDGLVEEQHLRILFVDVTYRLRYRLDPVTRRIRWHLDPAFDNDLRRVEGFWELSELDASHTLGRFGTAVDVGNALPAFVEESLTRQSLSGT